MICVSIAEAEFSACLSLIKQYDFIELRLDAASFSTTQIEKLIKSAKKAIATFRPGQFDLKTRMHALITSIQSGASMIDLEIDAPADYSRELMKQARSVNCEVIISHHDFILTPSKVSLENILKECYSKGADIAKITCQVKSEGDNARLLSLYSKPGRKVILGMGDLGRITRVASLYLGAEFSFAAPDKGKTTATGQLSFKELQAIQNILNLKSR
jgi:3-dehydroquinate dehydratase I